jgi:hypothetical protein
LALHFFESQLNFPAASAVKPLIFDRLSVAWEEIMLPAAFRPAVSGEALCSRPLHSFPTPGRLTASPIDDVARDPRGLRFPKFGAYYLLGDFGAAKLLLLDPSESSDTHLMQLLGFVSGSVWHSANDTYLCFDNNSQRVFNPRRLMTKLFYSDQPLGVKCAIVSNLLAYLLFGLGYSCRRVRVRNEGGENHAFLDVFLPEAGKWAYFDGDFGVMLASEDGFLSAAEVVALRNAGRDDEIQIVDCGKKHFTLIPEIRPASFAGQMTWRPELMSNRKVSEDPRFRQVVRNGFKAVDFIDYELVAGDAKPAPLPQLPADLPRPVSKVVLDLLG